MWQQKLLKAKINCPWKERGGGEQKEKKNPKC
jgi:hypothetical protein